MLVPPIWKVSSILRPGGKLVAESGLSRDCRAPSTQPEIFDVGNSFPVSHIRMQLCVTLRKRGHDLATILAGDEYSAM